VIGASRTATPDDEFPVCTTLPDESISTNCIGTLMLDSTATEIALVPAGNVRLRIWVCPPDCVELDSVVVPGPFAGAPVALVPPHLGG